MRTDPQDDQDQAMMQLALEAARTAAAAGETPVGAVIFDPATGEVLGTAGNGRKTARSS